MLTLKDLKAMQSNLIFATGVVENSPLGIFMSRSGGMLRWVAVRGGIWDWAIYCHWEDKSKEWIRDYGDKVHDEVIIKTLVPCTDEAFKMYRY